MGVGVLVGIEVKVCVGVGVGNREGKEGMPRNPNIAIIAAIAPNRLHTIFATLVCFLLCGLCGEDGDCCEMGCTCIACTSFLFFLYSYSIVNCCYNDFILSLVSTHTIRS